MPHATLVFVVSCLICLSALFMPQASQAAAGESAVTSAAQDAPGRQSSLRGVAPTRADTRAAHPAPDWDKADALAPDPLDPGGDLQDGIALPGKSGGRESPAAVVAAMRPLLDIRALRQGLDEIGLLKDAGFVYQAGLTVPKDICPQPGDWDQAAVLSGMAASDQAYALFFGKPEEAARENRLLRKLSPGMRLPSLTRAERAVLRKDPTGAAGRKIIVRRTEAQVRAMLEAASKSEADLRLLGAHLYGLFLERLYTTSIMVLAAAESGTLEPLYKAHAGLVARQGRILVLLGRRNLIGDSRFAANRREAVDSLLRLLASNKGRPSLAQVEEILGIVREERASFLTPCP